MKSTHFFRISWIIQLAVGICLFTVSFLIEKQVLEAFITTPLLALLLAASLELGKAVAIVWHRFMSYQTATSYPASVKWASNTFRLGLVLLSIICSLLFLSDNLDRPNLESVRTAEVSRKQQQMQDYLKRIELQKQTRLDRLQKSQQSEYQNLEKGYQVRIESIQKELQLEMNNVVNGTFKGPRYAEIMARLEKEQRFRNQALAKVAADNKKAYERESNRLLDELEAKQEEAYLKSIDTLDAIETADFANDERANDSRIVSFLQVLESVFGTQIFPLQFVFIFSLLISFLMEIGILLAFNTITLSILPALRAIHEADLSSDMLHTEMGRETKEDALRHENAINKIRHTANNVMDKAREYMQANNA